MTAKKIATIALLSFTVVAVGVMFVKGRAPEPPADAVVTVSAEDILLRPDANIDVVYYFLTTQRCPSCQKIEAYTSEAVRNTFAGRIADKKMIWKTVNVDLRENAHFIRDYKLFTKSVIVVRYRDGRQVDWKNLDQVWMLLTDKAAFQDYVVREITAFVGEG